MNWVIFHTVKAPKNFGTTNSLPFLPSNVEIANSMYFPSVSNHYKPEQSPIGDIRFEHTLQVYNKVLQTMAALFMGRSLVMLPTGKGPERHAIMLFRIILLFIFKEA